MDQNYVEALNACSIESYEGYFEDLQSKGRITKADLKVIEGISPWKKGVAYALAILACEESSKEAKAYARELLQSCL